MEYTVLTNQQMFDNALRGVRAQGCASRDKETNSSYPRCLYRGPDGTKCGIGQSLPDALYRPKMDTCTMPLGIMQLLELYPDVQAVFGPPPTPECGPDFRVELQIAHDGAYEDDPGDFISGFNARMRELAEEFQLQYEEPKT